MLWRDTLMLGKENKYYTFVLPENTEKSTKKNSQVTILIKT